MRTATTNSKLIGWDRTDVSYPTLERAMELREKIAEGDEDALLEVMRYNRFLPSPMTDEQFKILSELQIAYRELREEG